MEIIEAGKKESALIITITDRMDVVSAPQFENKIGEWMAEGKIHFIIDLSELALITSAGLRAILITAKKLEAKGGTMILAGPKGAVEKVLKVSGFSALIPIHKSVDAALNQI